MVQLICGPWLAGGLGRDASAMCNNQPIHNHSKLVAEFLYRKISLAKKATSQLKASRCNLLAQEPREGWLSIRPRRR
jgi:hypothetical protein